MLQSLSEQNIIVNTIANQDNSIMPCKAGTTKSETFMEPYSRFDGDGSCIESDTVNEPELSLFYSDANMAHLRRGIQSLNAGKGREHKLIEVD